MGIVGEEGEVTFGAFVGVVSFVAAFEACDLFQGLRGPSGWRTLHLSLLEATAIHVAHCAIAKLILSLDSFSLFLWHLLTIRGLVAQFSAVMARGSALLQLIPRDFRRWRQFEPRMHILALLPIWTKTCQVICTENSTDMPMATMGPMPAESSVIPRTILYLALRINVQKWALFVVASIEPGIEVALGHLCHVIFVQEFTLIPLFAQSSQPVLADNCSIAPDVPKWACSPLVTFHPVPAIKELTNSSRRL